MNSSSSSILLVIFFAIILVVGIVFMVRYLSNEHQKEWERTCSYFHENMDIKDVDEFIGEYLVPSYSPESQVYMKTKVKFYKLGFFKYNNNKS